MGEVSLNSFNKGMTQDLGKTLPQDGSYLEGRNIRIIANESSEETGILVNVEGNSFSFKLEYNCATCESLWEATGSLQMYSTNYVVPVHSFVKIGGQIYITDPDAEEWGGITIPANEELLEDIIKEERDLSNDIMSWISLISSDPILSLQYLMLSNFSIASFNSFIYFSSHLLILAIKTHSPVSNKLCNMFFMACFSLSSPS